LANKETAGLAAFHSQTTHRLTAVQQEMAEVQAIHQTGLLVLQDRAVAGAVQPQIAGFPDSTQIRLVRYSIRKTNLGLAALAILAVSFFIRVVTIHREVVVEMPAVGMGSVETKLEQCR
jgi:hypothetical protein